MVVVALELHLPDLHGLLQLLSSQLLGGQLLRVLRMVRVLRRDCRREHEIVGLFGCCGGR